MESGTTQLPSGPGTYMLLMSVKAAKKIRVGKLGSIDFNAGWYVYVGSAMGPGGVASRVHRHLRKNKKAHWHIDYLRPATRIEGVFVEQSRKIKEHRWALGLANGPFSGEPIPGFGCTDCRCGSHLLFFQNKIEAQVIARHFNARWIGFGG